MSVVIYIKCPENFEPKAVSNYCGYCCGKDEECYFCDGEGEIWTNELDVLDMNLSNANFSAFLDHTRLGIYNKSDSVDYGEVSLVDARRALIRGMNTSSAPFTEKPSHTKRPGKATFINSGRSQEQMADYVERFGRLLAKAEEVGAKCIVWC